MTDKPHYKLVTGVPQHGDTVVVTRPQQDAVLKIGTHGFYRFHDKDTPFPHLVWLNDIPDIFPLKRDEFIALRRKN